MTLAPDSTAVRTALWRAMHVQVDAPPHVLEDDLGLKLAAPEDGWRDRPDMHPQRTSRMRAAIVARARFVEDIVVDQAARGVTQYVLLGAGLDTFAQRRADVSLRVFEIDRPGAGAWKAQRLAQLGLGVSSNLHLVSVDFEGGVSWWERLVESGFDPNARAVVASTGVAMYLGKKTNEDTLRQLAKLAPGSTSIMTFLLPIDLLDPEDRPAMEWAMKGAAASGTPFATLYRPEEMVAMARAAGFAEVRHVSGVSHRERYFAGRADGLAPSSGEDLIVATT